MKVVFLSNYFNHHQSAISECFYRLTKGEYWFIETQLIDDERKNMGWEIDNYPQYIKRIYESDDIKRECIELINNADLVITGSAPNYLLKERLKANKLVFRYSERIYKKKGQRFEMPLRAIKYHFENKMSKNVYLLCSSAYAAGDYAVTGNFLKHTYKWGYFPEINSENDINELMRNKNEASILWAGRLIRWKHPEIVIDIAKKLKLENIKFKISIIGNGELEDELKRSIIENKLEQNVNLLGAMKPYQVREYMKKSQIFLFTSDYNEGWGAVLNEAMSSGCAVVTSHAIGAVPFLIQDGENGLIYKNGDFNDIYNKVSLLLRNPELKTLYGLKAYNTIFSLWNENIAAERVLDLARNIINGDKEPNIFVDGPCSKALIIKNRWYRKKKLK